MTVFYIFIGALAIVHCASQATDSHRSSDSRSVGLSLSSTKNDSGQWTDLFSARTEHSSALHSITMDVQHNITECDGRRVIHIQASIQKGRDQLCRKGKLKNGRGGDCTKGCGGRDKIEAEGEINEGTGNGRKLQLGANSTDEDDCTIYREINCEDDSRIQQRDIQARVVLGAANIQTEGTDVPAAVLEMRNGPSLMLQ